MPQSSRKPRVLVAGQVPPPISGQNLVIADIISILSASPVVEVDHWVFRFTPNWSNARRFGISKSIELIRVWFRLFRLRIQGPIDVVLYPVGGPHLAPVLRDLALLPLTLLLSKKVILHFHAAGFAEAVDKFPSPLAYLLKKIYRACNHAVVMTEFGKRDPEAAGVENISVIPNARKDEFRPDWKKPPTSGESITILNVGLLCPDKGTPQLLEAFSKVHAHHPDTTLNLVGSPMAGLSSELILEKATELGIENALKITGVLNRDALQKAYAEADIFVFSSIAPFESFGNVLSEAMMWALPVVATDWRGNAQVLGENHGGELAATGAELSENLAIALEKVIEQRAQWADFGDINRRRFLERYQMKQLESELERLFRSETIEQG